MKLENDYFSKLKDKFLSTDGSIDSFRQQLNTIKLSGYLDQHEVREHNALLFSDSPKYIHNSFEDLALLEITSSILESGKFNTFDELKSFFGFIDENKYFKEMSSCINYINIADMIIGAEGSRAIRISGLSQPRLRNLLSRMVLSEDSTVQFHRSFPESCSEYDGPTLCRLIEFFDSVKNKDYTAIRSDIAAAYPDFRISTIDYYKENDRLEDFCITVQEFHKTFE